MSRESLSCQHATAAARSLPLYLIVFSFHVPLSYREIYSTYYGLYGVAPAFFALLAPSLLLFGILYLTLRDAQLAGLGALIALLVLVPKAALAGPVYPIIAMCGAGAVVHSVMRQRDLPIRERLRLPRSFTQLVNIVTVMMTIAVGAWAAYSTIAISAQAAALSEKGYSAIRRVLPTEPPTVLPHIVHIVLDGYSRADVLKNLYGFDNGPFLDALRQRGFRISSTATTPFNQTLFVMASIFALEPITDALGQEHATDDNATLRRILAHQQEHGVVARILADLGYDLHSTPSTYLPLQWERISGSDDNFPTAQHLQLPGTYVLTYDLLSGSPILGPLIEHLLGDRLSIVAVNYRYLKKVPDRRFPQPDDRPLFLYQHIIAPHPPFNIRADGGVRQLNGLPASLADGSHIIYGQDIKRSEYRAGYVDKLKYINAAILEQIDRLKETLSEPLIIILHGDHGGGLYFDQEEAANTCVAERFSPLLAVYASDDAITHEFTDDFNLVNIYRAIFRVLLKSDIPNLPNRRMFISWQLDEKAVVHANELALSCRTPDEIRTSGNSTSSFVGTPAN